MQMSVFEFATNEIGGYGMCGYKWRDTGVQNLFIHWLADYQLFVCGHVAISHYKVERSE